MEKTGGHRLLRVPSPAMIVACVALFVALGGTSYAAATLAANSVGTKQLKKNAVTAVKIKAGAITETKIGDAAVTGAKIRDGAVTQADLVDGAVAGPKVADGAIGSAKLANGAVTQAKLTDGAVGTSKMGVIPGARVRRTAAQSVNSNSTLVLAYDTVDFNVGGVFAAGQPTRMTAPVAGRYLIGASVRWESDKNGRRVIALELNNSAQIARSNASPYSQNGITSLGLEHTAFTVYRLNAGDYVEVWAYQDSGGPLALGTNVDNGVTFWMEWLAP